MIQPQPAARRALITGASSGIGEAFARRLASWHDLVLVARDEARLHRIAAEIAAGTGRGVEVLVADLTTPEGLARVEARITGGSPIDLLINNAGMGTVGAFAESDIAREVAEIELNVVALVRLSRAAVEPMVRRGRGAILQVSSLAAYQPGPYNATYAATKAFVNSFSEALHEELRGTGVKVQVLCPGFTRTEFQQRAGIEPRLPGFAWMEAGEVVDASLRGLRRGSLIVVPGFGNNALRYSSRLTPRPLVRRISGLLGRRMKQ